MQKQRYLWHKKVWSSHTVQWDISPRCKLSRMVSLALTENFPIYKLTSPTTKKSHMSDI